MKTKLEKELSYTCSICMSFHKEGDMEAVREHMVKEHSMKEITEEAMLKEL